ncbi:MAG: phosphoenolpyruvate mutase [Candidatus Obscuribacterales bacterium]|nr:phosphoenolpyruvate mutase [Candidatus Obscuribacterales bacterium]
MSEKPIEGNGVYIALCADLIHPGHLNVVKHATTLGELTVGVISDKAMACFHRLPLLTWEQRKAIVEGLKGVSNVIMQDSLDYERNLRELKPRYVVHGDDWVEGPQRRIRDRVIDILAEWGGELVEIPYVQGISSAALDQEIRLNGTTPSSRMRRFRRLLSVKSPVKLIEAHSGLTAVLVENCQIEDDNGLKEFDGVWLSSLTDSTAKGKPDIEYVDKTSRLATLQDILESTTKPIVFDGDSGGVPEHFVFTVRSLERLGISAVVIEDKVGLKKNSLLDSYTTEVVQDSIENFCYKIREGRAAKVTPEFMIVARIESLNLGKGIEDAYRRADAYLAAGADSVMIHSKSKDGKDVLEFSRKFRKQYSDVPLVVVPSTYTTVYDYELSEAGANVIIYANHLLRSAYPAMLKTALAILRNGRTHEIESELMPIKDMIGLIPGGT